MTLLFVWCVVVVVRSRSFSETLRHAHCTGPAFSKVSIEMRCRYRRRTPPAHVLKAVSDVRVAGMIVAATYLQGRACSSPGSIFMYAPCSSTSPSAPTSGAQLRFALEDKKKKEDHVTKERVCDPSSRLFSPSERRSSRRGSTPSSKFLPLFHKAAKQHRNASTSGLRHYAVPDHNKSRQRSSVSSLSLSLFCSPSPHCSFPSLSLSLFSLSAPPNPPLPTKDGRRQRPCDPRGCERSAR